MQGESARLYLSALRNALLLLSLAPSEQWRRTAPACAACELLDDLQICCRDVLENLELSVDQTKPLYELLNIVGDMSKTDLECFNPQVLEHAVWQSLRQKATNALSAFGWQDARPEPFSEIEPGVWLRRSGDA